MTTLSGAGASIALDFAPRVRSGCTGCARFARGASFPADALLAAVFGDGAFRLGAVLMAAFAFAFVPFAWDFFTSCALLDRFSAGLLPRSARLAAEPPLRLTFVTCGPTISYEYPSGSVSIR